MFRQYAMEVIADELRKNNVDIDILILSRRINYVLVRHGKLYDEMAERLGPDGLLNVFGEMNVNSFGRATAYLTLVYLMDIPEDVKYGRPLSPKIQHVWNELTLSEMIHYILKWFKNTQINELTQ